MSSAFDDQYGDGVASTLMEYFAASTVLTYVDGDNVSQSCRGILGHIDVVEVEVGDGTIRKEYRRTLHVLRDEANATWPGVNSVQVRAHFVIDGWSWQVEDRENQAIQGESETFATVSLVRKAPVDGGQPNLRRYS